jgi:hypothetical protein
MNSIEDRIRAAAHAAADTVPPDGVPPLRLPPKLGSRRWRPTRSGWAGRGRAGAGWARPGRGGWARRLTPLAAAVAVVVVVVSVVGIGRTMHSPAGHAPAATAGLGPVVAGPPISSYVTSGQVPPYYVAIISRDGTFYPYYAVVKATVSGKTLATIQPSVARGSILAATAAADGRTFVLEEQRFGDSQPFDTRTFYEFRLSSSGQPGPLTRLPMTVPNGELLTGMALSPDGSKLAITVEPDNDKKEPNLTTVSVYTLATGAVRTWTANGVIGAGADDARSLSWTANGRTLAFDWQDAADTRVGVWLLDLGARGTNLIADSHQAVSLFPFPQSSPGEPSAAVVPRPTCLQQDSIITPDGSTIVCGAIAAANTKITAPRGFTRGAVTEFREYSTATGEITRILGHWKFASVGTLSAEVLWSNASGSVLIGVIPNAGNGRIGVISGNTFTPLPAQVASSGAVTGTW